MAYRGVAVSQIILLVLGILVLAVVAYLLYTNFVSTGNTISAETCRAEATRICTGCTIANPQSDNKNCKFTSTTMTACVTQQRVVGGSSAGTIDCSVVTGTNPLAAATPPSNNPPAQTPSQTPSGSCSAKPTSGSCPADKPFETVVPGTTGVQCCSS